MSQKGKRTSPGIEKQASASTKGSKIRIFDMHLSLVKTRLYRPIISAF
jgi:hypothetical protein